MSDDIEYSAYPDDSQFVRESAPDRLARHWAVLLTVGVITLALGVTLSFWPRETVAVAAVLLAFQLVLAGCAQLFVAIASPDLRGAARAATALAGAAGVVVGVLLLFSPLQTLTFIGWAAGLCVVAVGLADLLGAMSSSARRHRGWRAVRGVLGLAIGIFLVANPDRSLGLLVVIACVWLISYGAITIVAALLLRSEHRRAQESPKSAGQAPPAPA